MGKSKTDYIYCFIVLLVLHFTFKISASNIHSSNLYSRLIVRQILIQNRPRESLDKISLERMRKPNFKLSVALNFSLKVDQDAYQTLKKMLHNYDTRVRPNYTGPPTIVKLDYSILSFGHIEEVDMVFPSDLFFRQRWNDHRLKHNMERSLVLMTGTKKVPDVIWVPDTVFINSIDSKMHDVTISNNKLDIFPNGDVFWGTRISVRSACRLDLKSYPMDIQHCSISVESYTYTTDHLMYKWHNNPGITILDREMSQFSLEGFNTEEKFINYAAGNYSLLNATFTFKRRIGNAILRVYIPTIAIVCVSWVSLWIDQDSTPARTALCITTLLTLSTIWGSVNSTLPSVSYIKAVDLFFLVSFFFVFSTLVEYVLVLNFSTRARAKKRKKKSDDDFSARNEPIAESALSESSSNNGNSESPEVKMVQFPGLSAHENLRRRMTVPTQRKPFLFSVTKIVRPETSNFDKLARVAMPLGYFMFNIYYWVTYLGSDELKRFPR